jgi:hypothetical protein
VENPDSLYLFTARSLKPAIVAHKCITILLQITRQANYDRTCSECQNEVLPDDNSTLLMIVDYLTMWHLSP